MSNMTKASSGMADEKGKGERRDKKFNKFNSINSMQQIQFKFVYSPRAEVRRNRMTGRWRVVMALGEEIQVETLIVIMR